MAKQVPARNGGTLTRPDKGETMNPNGRPRKGIALVNHELEEKGIEPATKQDIEANYLSLINADQATLVEIAGDKKKPMLARVVAKAILDKKGFDIVERMLDRSIGKPKQTDELRFSGDVVLKWEG